MLDWILMIFYLFSMYLIEEKKKIGWYISLVSIPLWGYLYFINHLYGLLPIEIASLGICLRAIKTW
jgi:hypothetical protein